MKAKGWIIAVVVLIVGLIVGYLIGGRGGLKVTQQGAGTASEHVVLKMASAFAGTMPVIGEGGLYISDTVSALSGGTLELKFYDPGKLMPAFEIFDSVSNGAVDAGYATAGFWYGKLPAASIFSSIPFGPDTSEFLSWLFQGEGLKLYQDLYARHNIWVYPCAMIPPEASGWFHNEITKVDQFKGLKIRFFGIGGEAMQKLGASVQLLAPGDIYPALERGVIDATEFSLPVMDQRLGFYKAAKHYYFPGWHQQATTTELLINMNRWKALSAQHQAIIEATCKSAIVRTLTLGETVQGKAIAEMEAEGVKVHYWPNEILDAFKKANDQVLADLSAKDPDFKRNLESLQAFRASFKKWAELSRLPKGY